MRCLSTGTATLRISSSDTLKRPSIAAIALPARIKFCPARAGAVINQLLDESGCFLVRRPGRANESCDVVDRVLRDGHRHHEFLKVDDRLAREHFLQVWRLASSGGREDLLFFVERGVSDPHVEHEPVKLGFGQRIGSLLLDGVLGGDHEKGVGQVHGLLSDGDFPFLHCLQQGCLRFGRCSVDLVGKDDIGKKRSSDEPECPPARFGLFEDIGAGDVGRHEVGRELDSLESYVEDPRDRADHESLRQPGHTDQEHVPPGEDRGQDEFNNLALTDDDLVELVNHHVARMTKFVEKLRDPIARSGHALSRPLCRSSLSLVLALSARKEGAPR